MKRYAIILITLIWSLHSFADTRIQMEEYRQVPDIYATSVDYESLSNSSVKFFNIVQNNLYYAVMVTQQQRLLTIEQISKLGSLKHIQSACFDRMFI